MTNSPIRYTTVVGVDFSPHSTHALDEALGIAALRGGELHVVHVEPETPADLLPARGLLDTIHADADVERVQRSAQERIDAYPGDLRGLSRVVAHTRRGSPAREIAALAASLDADLVVVGSHGRHGFDRFFLGSVAEHVVRLARCPVWVVRPKDHATEPKVPTIEPPCPDCVARRAATGGASLWCARHSEHHPRAHRYAYVANGLYASETTPYEATPEG